MLVFEKPFPNLSDAAINPNTGKLYLVNMSDAVGESSGGHVAVFHTTLNGAIAHSTNIPVSFYPSNLVINPNTNTIYLLHNFNCPEGSTVTVIDGNTDNVTGNIEDNMVMRNWAHGIYDILVNPVINRIYVSNGTAMSIIDGNRNEVLDTIAIVAGGSSNLEDIKHENDKFVRLMAISPENNLIYGVREGNRTLAILDLRSNSIINTDTRLNAVLRENAIDSYPVDMIINSETSILYIMNQAIIPQHPDAGISIPTADIIAVNASTGEIISESMAEVQNFHFDLTLDAKQNRLYALSGSNSFVAIDTSNNKVIGKFYFETGELPNFYPRMVLNPETGILYFVGSDAIIAISTETLTSSTNKDSVPVPEIITDDGADLSLALAISIGAGITGIVAYLAFRKKRQP